MFKTVVDTTIRMLRDRGCQNLATIKELPLCRLAIKCDSTFVFFLRGSKLKVANMRTLLNSDQAKRKKTILFICEQGITPYAKKELDTERCQVFNYQQLLIPVALHLLVPPHRRLQGDEKIKLLARYPANTLPVLQFNDPVARYYFFKVGDVIGIERTYCDGHKNEYFRLVSR